MWGKKYKSCPKFKFSKKASTIVSGPVPVMIKNKPICTLALSKKCSTGLGLLLKLPSLIIKYWWLLPFSAEPELTILLKAACWIWPLWTIELDEPALWESNVFKQLANSCLCSEENTMWKGEKLRRKMMEETGTKPKQIPKRRRSCTHKRHPRQSECWSRKQLALRVKQTQWVKWFCCCSFIYILNVWTWIDA